MVDEDLGEVLNNLDKAQNANVISLKNDGNAYYKQGLYEEALDCYIRALQIDPDNTDLLNNTGLVLVKLGKIDEAKECNERIKEIKNNSQSIPVPKPAVQSPTTPEIRKPWFAVLFSLFCPGWGQWYNGRTWDGVEFFGGYFGTAFIMYFVMALSFIFYRTFQPAFLLVLLVIWAYGMYDAYKTARRINRCELEFKGKSRLFWLPLVLFVIVIIMVVTAVGTAFVFGMSYPDMSRTVAVTAHTSGNGMITIQNMGGPDVYDVTSFRVTVDGLEPATPLGPQMGSTINVQGKSGSKNHVIVLATFKDGVQQVVLDEYV